MGTSATPLICFRWRRAAPCTMKLRRQVAVLPVGELVRCVLVLACTAVAGEKIVADAREVRVLGHSIRCVAEHAFS